MIRTERDVRAPAEVVDRLLRDVEAWGVWSPHVSWVEPPTGHVDAGWVGRVKPWYGPTTTMRVTWAEPGKGMRWHSAGLGHQLRYENLVETTGLDACRVVFTAEVVGSFAGVLERLVGPVSGLGQRRRLARLARLAELTARNGGL